MLRAILALITAVLGVIRYFMEDRDRRALAREVQRQRDLDEQHEEGNKKINEDPQSWFINHFDGDASDDRRVHDSVPAVPANGDASTKADLGGDSK